MEKIGHPPPYSWNNGHTLQPPPAAPPSYSQAVGGVGPSSPYTPQYPPSAGPPIVTTVVPVGPHPTHMICPSCHAEIDTTTKTKPSTNAYLCGGLICLLGGWLGCCLIPCCLNSCIEVHHSCPYCSAYLGRYRR
ncbi:hypothetical protein O0L34_g2672 [Tuta absoluta]|nr:hypothetical protein O0L34_g2672 [Tuta absoluta]